MTRSELLNAWAYRLNKTPLPDMDSATQARALTFFNQRQRRLLTLPGLTHLREATVTLSSVANQADYVLPNIGKIARIWDPTNQRVLYQMSQQDQRLIDPIPISGTPEAFVWRGRQALAKQPSDASSLFVKSTSAADTTTAWVTGVITGSYPVATSVALSGTTAVNVASTISTWIRGDKFYVSAVCAGTVTLHEDSGAGTELARITIGQTSTDYWGFSLWPTPSGVNDYSIDIVRAVVDLASDADEPVLPIDFHDVIVLGAVMDEYQHLNDKRYGTAAKEYEARVGELRYWLAETAIGQPFSLTRGWQRPSQLGSWFPAGS